MANTTMPLFFLGLFFSFLFFVQYSQARLAPALYLFGDSILDCGNNNRRHTLAKANFPPYGIDFPAGATGRFSNGHNFADYFSEWLELPLPISAMDWNFDNVRTYRGFNYASASSGILPQTGSSVGSNLSMKKQIGLFRKTAQKYLLMHFKSEAKLSHYLSKSIFVVLTGSNDYAQNYLRPLDYNTSRLFNPIQFADLLVNELGNHLEDLYMLGARKFVVFEIGPLGCLPATVALTKPITKCNEDVNALISIYNNMLAAKLIELSSKLKGSTFVTNKIYQFLYALVQNPLNYGFKDSRNACCPGSCVHQIPCRDRNSHVFWDQAHPTEAATKIAATQCFNGTGLCTPINLHQLVQKH